MAKQKWFYPLQKQVNARLTKDYRQHNLNYQDICEDHVYENYIVHTANNVLCIQVVMSRMNESFHVFEYVNDK